jgi:hypothetical protein
MAKKQLWPAVSSEPQDVPTDYQFGFKFQTLSTVAHEGLLRQPQKIKFILSIVS